MTEYTDNQLRQLLGDFKPSLKSDAQFMQQLQQKIDAVELVKQHNDAESTRNRRALIPAVIAAFICGIAATLSFPAILSRVEVLVGLAGRQLPASLNVTIGCAFVAAVTALVGYTAYDLGGALVRRRDNRR